MATKSKTHKATAKRFKLTGSKKKVIYKKQGDNNHYMTKMNSKQKLRAEQRGTLASTKEAKKLIQIGNLS